MLVFRYSKGWAIRFKRNNKIEFIEINLYNIILKGIYKR